MQDTLAEKDMHRGHRERMRNKLARHSTDIFETYELLEMLLYHVIPYRDTKPQAKLLLAKFGSLDALLSASREELLEIPGIGERAAELLIALDKVAVALGAEVECVGVESKMDFDAVGKSFVDYFAEHRAARFAVMLLNNDMHLIDLVGYEDTDFNSASVNPRLFIELTLKRGAGFVVTAQNKLYGFPLPLPSDRETLKMIYEALNEINVSYLEHYLVSEGGFIGSIDTITGNEPLSAALGKILKTGGKL